MLFLDVTVIIINYLLNAAKLKQIYVYIYIYIYIYIIYIYIYIYVFIHICNIYNIYVCI